MRQFKRWLMTAVSLIALTVLVACGQKASQTKTAEQTSQAPEQPKQTQTYQVSEEEKAYLQERFQPLLEQNKDTIAYIYAPGTMLDEPVVQTTDNEHYLKYTIDGQEDPFLGTVFMDYENSKTFDNQLTWLFGHARGSQVDDHRMFNDVNFYEDQTYFDEHPYVVIETPERKFYYEAAFMIIVPETTAFYRTSFDSNEQFKQQLTDVAAQAKVKNDAIQIKETDKYLVLSTCREEDTTIRSNLYLRQIPDSELETFLAEHQDQLGYVPTR